jgi:hypothetical protein
MFQYYKNSKAIMITEVIMIIVFIITKDYDYSSV